MTTYKPRRFRHPDLTRSEGTPVGKMVEPLVISMNSYKTLGELKEAFREVIHDPKTSVSKHKIAEYENILERMFSITSMRKFVTNVYLNAANLGTD